MEYRDKLKLINNRFRVDARIGAGGRGLVFLGTDFQTGGRVAIKLEKIGHGPQPSTSEADAYRALSGGVGIPLILWSGVHGHFHVIISELLGPSLEELLDRCDRRFSLKTVILIAEQAISRIEYIHSKNLLHRDIKPDNFLMGPYGRENTLYAIDFGLAENFGDAERYENQRGLPFGGTARYASIRSHSGHQQSWGDDLESLGYLLVYLARGSLPWQGLKAPTEREKYELIMQKKMSLSGEDLCDGVLPDEFATLINYARSRGFHDKPDYPYLHGLFRHLFEARGFHDDSVFDWTNKSF
ncbi:casein kinase [Cladorrhinum sp. PSN259]|nr:casein kinase [Cladorrhinum sp. PSN259]